MAAALADPSWLWLCLCFPCVAMAGSASALGLWWPRGDALGLLRQSVHGSAGKRSILL